MRLSDSCLLPLAALWQQKTRTVLTTLGVIFGSFVLAASLSTNQGVSDAIGRELQRGDALRRIEVRQQRGDASQPVAVNGKMSADRRERIEAAVRLRKQNFDPEPSHFVLNRENLRVLQSLDHVEKVIPTIFQYGTASIGENREQTVTFGVPIDSEHHRSRLIAGRFFRDPRERSAIINEFLAYRLGIVDESAVEQLVGKTVRFEIPYIHRNRGAAKRDGGTNAAVAAATRQLLSLLGQRMSASNGNRARANPFPPAEDSLVREFTIVGITRLPTRQEGIEEHWDRLNQDAEILLPMQTSTDMFFDVPRQAVNGLEATVIADREESVEPLLERIQKMGLQGFAYREGIKRERLMYSLIFRGMTCVAAVALFVAALGIANTMLMSVLERSREIGIMKAVGASNAEVQFIFLTEGALIGLIGGGLGLLFAWLASYPGDAWVRSMVSRDMKVDLKETLFVLPPWLVLSVLLFAALVTTLAALYPAHRAARIDPVSALRHE